MGIFNDLSQADAKYAATTQNVANEAATNTKLSNALIGEGSVGTEIDKTLTTPLRSMQIMGAKLMGDDSAANKMGEKQAATTGLDFSGRVKHELSGFEEIVQMGALGFGASKAINGITLAGRTVAKESMVNASRVFGMSSKAADKIGTAVGKKGIKIKSPGMTDTGIIIGEYAGPLAKTGEKLLQKAKLGTTNVLTGEGKKGIGRILLDNTAEQSAYAAVFTAPMLAETHLGDKGEFKTNYDFEHFDDVFFANLGFAAPLVGGVHLIGKASRWAGAGKTRKGLNANKYTKINLDDDGIAAINHTILAEIDGKIKNANGMESEIQTFNGGFIHLDDFNKIVGTKYKSAHEIKESKTSFAVVDAEGNMAINTPGHGHWKGVVNQDGSNKIIFNKDSKVTGKATETKYDGKRMLEPVGDEAVNIAKRTFKQPKQHFTSPKQAFEWKEDGTIGKAGLAGDTKRRMGQAAINRFADKNPIMKTFAELSKDPKDAPKMWSPDEAVTIDKRDNNIISQLLFAKDIPETFMQGLRDSPSTQSIAKLIDYVKGFRLQLGNKFDLRDFVIKDTSPENLARYEKFFTLDKEFILPDNTKAAKVIELKPEFKAAIDAGYALSLAKQNDATLMQPGALKKASIQEAFNLMGAKPSVTEEMLKQDIISRALLDNDMQLAGLTKTEIGPNGEVIKGSELEAGIMTKVEQFGNDSNTRGFNINEILTNGEAAENGGMILTNEPGKLFSKLADKDSQLVKEHEETIKAMLNTEHHITAEHEGIINNLHSLINEGSPYGGTLTKNEQHIGLLFGDITHAELQAYNSNKWAMHEREVIWNQINKHKQEISLMKRALDSHRETGNPIRFDVEFDPHLRPRSKGSLSPQSNKLSRVLLSTDDRLVRMDTPEMVELAKRATLANLGIKVETIHKYSTIEKLFEAVKIKLMDVDASGNWGLKKEYAMDGSNGKMLNAKQFAKDVYEEKFIFDIDNKKYDIDTEGAITFGTIDNMLGVAEGRAEINIFAEIDSKMSGTALTLARLGYKDGRFGLGQAINGSEADMYNELAKAFGGAISRAQAKPILNGFNYESSIFTAAKAGVEGMFKSYFRGGELPELINAEITHLKQTHQKIIATQRKLNKSMKEMDELATQDVSEFTTAQKSERDSRMSYLKNDIESTGEYLVQQYDVPVILDALKRIENKEMISVDAQELMYNRFANNLTGKTETALNKIYKDYPIVKEFRKDTADTVYHVAQEFNYRYFEPKYSRDTAIAKLIQSAKEASNKTLTIEQANKMLADKTSYSIHSIVDTLARNDLFRRNLHDISILEDIIPFMHLGNGKRVPVVAPQGYMGYSEGVNYAMPTTSNIFTPLYTIGTDAAIMEGTLKPGMTSVFDAIIAGKSLYTGAQNMNKHFAGITDINPYEALGKLHREYVGANGGNPKIANQVWTNIATAQILSKGGKATEQAVKDLAKKLSKDDIYMEKGGLDAQSKIIMQRKRLQEGYDKVETNKADKGFKDDDIIANHSNGNEAGHINFKDRIKYTLEDGGKTNLEYDAVHDVTLAKMEDIKPNGDTATVLHFKDSSTGVATKTKDVKLSTAQESASHSIIETNGANIEHSVATTYEKFTPEALNELSHEFVHVEIASSPEPFLTKLQSTLLDLTRDTDASGNPRLTTIGEDGTHQLYKVSGDELFKGELVSSIMGDLYRNELLMKNYDKFANLFSKDGKNINLQKELTKFIFDGNEIYTTKDLSKILNKGEYKIEASLVHKMANGMNATLNGSEDILAFINGKPRTKFQSVVADANNGIKKGRDLINKANTKLGTMNVTDIFSLTAHDEAVQASISQVKIADNILLETSTKYGKTLQPLVDHPSNPKFAVRIGKAAIVGVQRFITELTASSTSKEFITAVKNKLIKSREIMKLTFNRQTVVGIEEYLSKAGDKLYTMNDIDKAATRLLRKEFSGNPKQLVANHKFLKDYLREAIVGDIVINKHSETVHNMFNDFTRPELKDNALSLLAMFNDRYANKKTLTGANPQINFAENHLKGIAVEVSKFDGKNKDIMATFNADGKRYHMISKESYKDIVGAQKSQQIEINLSPAMDGLYKIKMKGLDDSMYITPETLNTKHRAVEADVVEQLKRNMYTAQYSDVVNELAFLEFEKLRDSGVLMSRAKYDAQPKEIRQQYERRQINKKKTEKTPFDKTFGEFYYNKKYAKYFGGSKGFDIGKKNMQSIFGSAGGIISPMIKTLIGATAILKGPILIMRPASYINSLTSNMLIYAINSDDALGAANRYGQARTELASFKVKLNAALDNVVKGKPHAEAWKEVKNHKLWTAYENGIHSTIRTSAYETGAYAENMVFTMLNKLTKNEQLSDGLKFLTFDASTRHGNAMGKLFDATEMVPKIMMYLAKRDQLGSNTLAAQHVLLAYPTYNNLGHFWNGVDQFSPFTKYMINYPKMLTYAITMNPKKFIGLNAAFFLGVRASYGSAIDPDEEFWYNNNFADVGWGYKSTPSLNSYITPTKGITATPGTIGSMVSGDFVPSAIDSFTTGKFLNVTSGN